MKICPYCGNEIFHLDLYCPYCKRPLNKHFFIPVFCLEHFRLFTIIGVIGTMIAFLPNLAVLILGSNWIADQSSSLPLFISTTIFFGAAFITILFFSIFYLILQNRENEIVWKKITITCLNVTITIYDGDFQRFILLFCLIPLWFSISLFLITTMVFIPNVYSIIFASIVIFIILPLVCFYYLADRQAKNLIKASKEISESKQYNSLLSGFGKCNRINPIISKLKNPVWIYIILSGLTLLLLLYTMNIFNPIPGNDHSFSNNINIVTDQNYYSSQLSYEKGLKFGITNLSGRELLVSRHSWSTNYGYFVTIQPPVSDVIILGNPVYNYNTTFIYWTYPIRDIGTNKPPVKIQLQVYKLKDNTEIANVSLNLTWFDKDVAYANLSSTK
jgi:hypothetical protein